MDTYHIRGVEVGDVVDGKYVVRRVIAQSAVSVVVAAEHKVLGNQVAIKILSVPTKRREEWQARLLREARIVASIDSEHVARVLDVGTYPNGAPIIVMELLDGRDLAADLAKRGPMPVEVVADYMMEALDGVADAHARDVVHRDLKPANLFLSTHGDGSSVVKVLDFGLSKGLAVEQDEDRRLTGAGGLVGTPYYMSPEQIRGDEDLDPRSDIWSLGVVVFELLTGRLPFEQASLAHLCAAILSLDPPRLRDFRPDAPEDLERLVSRCLAKDPDRRYDDVAELAAAMARFSSTPETALTYAIQIGDKLARKGMRGSITGTTPRWLGSARPVAMSQPSRPSPSRVPSRKRKWAAAVAVTALAGGVVAFALGHWLRGAPPNLAASPVAAAASSQPASSASTEVAREDSPR